MVHPDEDLILRYIAERVGGDEQAAVDTHLADCRDCRERIRVLSYLRDHFDELWSSWSADGHGRIYRQWRLAKALAEVAEASPTLARRALGWLERLEEAVQVAVKVLVDPKLRIASTAAARLPSGYGFELRPAAAGVGAGERMVDLERLLKEGSLHLSRDRAEEAVETLRRAVKLDARSPQASISEVYCEGEWVMQIIADSLRGKVSLKFKRRREGPDPLLALLVPRGTEDPPLAAPFQPVEEADFLLAEFSRLPKGPFRIEIGPFSRED